MDFEAARAAIFARVDAGWTATYPAEPVEYENRRTVDRNAHPGPFLAVELVWSDGEQAELGNDPLIRYRGAIYCVVYVREGEGSAVGQTRLGYLASLLGVTSFGGVHTQAPKPVPGHDVPGWYRHILRVPFYFGTKP
jgi:hypothetical protein